VTAPVPDVDPHVLEADHLPTPYTAAEIREASPPGLVVRVLHEADGEEPQVTVSRFLPGDDDDSVREQWTETPDGRRLTPPAVRRVPWLGLQAHASFPAATTTRDEATIETPLGTLDCLRYVAGDSDSDAVDTFWFARSLPGMPVLVERRIGFRVVERATMTSHAQEG
jgi:hypothetical protein